MKIKDTRKIFCKKIHQVYQCNEGFLAHTCEKGNLHFNEDFLIIEKEYLDTEKKVLSNNYRLRKNYSTSN